MSIHKFKKPRHRFKVRRPASCRLESVESVAFHHALIEEQRRDAVGEHQLGIFLIEQAGLDPHALDLDALRACSTLLGVIEISGEPFLAIRPLDLSTEYGAFDAVICSAGLTRFVRPALPDGSEVPEREISPYILVQQLSPGIRVRLGVTPGEAS